MTTSEHIIGSESSVVSFDPRSSRFGMLYAGSNGKGALRDNQGGENTAMPLGRTFGMFWTVSAGKQYLEGWAAPAGSGASKLGD